MTDLGQIVLHHALQSPGQLEATTVKHASTLARSLQMDDSLRP